MWVCTKRHDEKVEIYIIYITALLKNGITVGTIKDKDK